MSTETQITKNDEGGMEQLRQGQYIQPPVDIFENSNEILLLADLPGVATSGLTVNLENGELTIQGCRTFAGQETEDAEDSGKKECVYHRAFKIPRSVDESKIDASLKLGVLELHMPKREALKPRQIVVRTD